MMASFEDNLTPAMKAAVKKMVTPSPPVSPRAANLQLDVDALRLSVLKAEPFYGQKPNGNGKLPHAAESIEKLVLKIKVPGDATPKPQESEQSYNTRLSNSLTEFLMGILKTGEGLEVAPQRQKTSIVQQRVLTDKTMQYWTLEVSLSGKALAAYIKEIGLQSKQKNTAASR
ncbi:MAG: hypothetical protein ACK52W_02345 [Alphaproteobacteria bacterium]